MAAVAAESSPNVPLMIPLTIILGLPILEVYLLFQAGMAWGFVNLFFFLIVKAMLGKLIMKRASLLSPSPQAPKPGNAPQVLKAMSLSLGGFLVALPALLTSAIGVLLVFSPSRWLLTKIFKKIFKNAAASGNFKIFNFENFAGFTNARGPNIFEKASPYDSRGSQDVDHQYASSHERDVTPQIIDVRPIQNKDKKD